MFKSIAVTAIALCFAGPVAQAQTDKQPWQATLTKTSHQPGAPKIYLDLPLPTAGRVLTLERIGIMVGPTFSPYGRVFSCEVESDRPKLDAAEFLENRTRVFLPVPVSLGNRRGPLFTLPSGSTPKMVEPHCVISFG